MFSFLCGEKVVITVANRPIKLMENASHTALPLVNPDNNGSTNNLSTIIVSNNNLYVAKLY